MRLIDADALLYDLEIVPLTGDGGVDANDLDDIIKRQPTVDPVKPGRWILEWETEDTRMLRCSECRMVFNVGKGRDGNYCPNCGCRMEVEHEE